MFWLLVLWSLFYLFCLVFLCSSLFQSKVIFNLLYQCSGQFRWIRIFYIHKISCKVFLEDCCYPLVQCWNKTSVMGSCLVDSLWMRIVLIALGRQSLLISCCWYISTSIYLFFLPILLSCSLLYWYRKDLCYHRFKSTNYGWKVEVNSWNTG